MNNFRELNFVWNGIDLMYIFLLKIGFMNYLKKLCRFILSFSVFYSSLFISTLFHNRTCPYKRRRVLICVAFFSLNLMFTNILFSVPRTMLVKTVIWLRWAARVVITEGHFSIIILFVAKTKEYLFTVSLAYPKVCLLS